MIFQKFSFVILVTLLFGCTSTKQTTAQTLDSWIGNTKQNLLLSWGPPTQTTSDGNNGEILVFAYHAYYPIDHWQYRMMYVNSQGKIYHWLYRKHANPPERIDIKILTN